LNECITLVPIGLSDNLRESIPSPLVALSLLRHINSGEINIKHPYHNINKDDLEGSLKNFEEFVANMNSIRAELPYSIDGIVITLADSKVIDKLGRTNNKNKYQIAYKFDAMVHRTTVTGILSTQGNSGRYGHNIQLKPISFNGIEYDMAPVNNISRFEKGNFRIGDEVLVSYNADVMGYIYKDETCDSGDGDYLKLPTHCLNCGTKLIITGDMLKCPNKECGGYRTGGIIEASKILGINFLGDETAKRLVEIGIDTPLKLISCTKEDFSKILSDVMASKVYNDFIIKIKSPLTFSKFIQLLRIDGFRDGKAKNMCDVQSPKKWIELIQTGNLDKLTSTLKKMKGVSSKASYIAEQLIDNTDNMISLYRVLNVVPDTSQDEYEMQVLISGFRENSELSKLCEELNFNIKVSESNDILIATEDKMDGKKAQDARKKGKPVYLLSEFLEKYKNV